VAQTTAFLGGAKSRLLPASVPFRFFAAAAAFHLIGWLALGAGAAQVASFRGGLGWPLAALHAVTLGVLVMTAIGASVQLLPVATRQPVLSHRLPAGLWWLYSAAVAVLVAAMAAGQPMPLAVGAAGCGLALIGWAVLLARNLLGARGMPVVVAHGWAALLGLGLLLASGASLVLMYLGAPAWSRSSAIVLHLAFGAYGFMGLLVLGFSYILVPMFALADSPPHRPAIASLARAALVLAELAAAYRAAAVVLPAAAIAGAGALALHVRLMRQALRSGLRRQLGRPFVLVHVGWAGLGASLVAGLALALQGPAAAFERAPALFGALLVLSLLTFLASMHAPAGRRGPPLPSTLTAERPLALFFRCHLVAVAALLTAVWFDSTWLVRTAALAGSVGALAFGVFVGSAWRRMRAGAKPPRVGADL
jgi:hypothetical protein